MEFLKRILGKNKSAAPEGAHKVEPYKPDYSATTAEPNPFTGDAEPLAQDGDMLEDEYEPRYIKYLKSKVKEFISGADLYANRLELASTIQYTDKLSGGRQTQLSPELQDFIAKLQVKIKKEEVFRAGDDPTDPNIAAKPGKPRTISYTGQSVFSRTEHPGVYWVDQVADWQSRDNMGGYGIIRKQYLMKDHPKNPSFWGLRK